MITTAQIAAHLRGELKSTFPGVKFTVQTKHAGGRIDVKWADGPTKDEVQKITNPLKLTKGTWGEVTPAEVTINTRDGQITGKSYVEHIFLTNTRTN